MTLAEEPRKAGVFAGFYGKALLSSSELFLKGLNCQ
jgi:hypothetical protein